MRLIGFCAAWVVLSASAAQAADLLSGTWTTGEGPTARVYVFKVIGDRFTGIVCGPCDNPASVFRIEDGRVIDENHASFFIAQQRVEASIARNAMTLAGANAVSLTRVVQNFELNPQPLAPLPGGSPRPPAAQIEGHWVSVGRTAQQNWIFKVRGNELWGLVCGPCTPAVVAMIDGRVDGDTITFYINHIDTPPAPNRTGIQRNVMTGTISGGDNANVLKFKWVSEGSGNTGEITMIGPVR